MSGPADYGLMIRGLVAYLRLDALVAYLHRRCVVRMNSDSLTLLASMLVSVIPTAVREIRFVPRYLRKYEASFY